MPIGVVILKVFAQAFFKKLVVSKGNAFGRTPQSAKYFIVRKRHRRVNFDEVKRGEPHKWGVPLSYPKTNLPIPW